MFKSKSRAELDDTGISVTKRIVRRVMVKATYNGRVSLKKSFVSEVNRTKCLQFTKHKVKKDSEFLNNVILCNMDKFNVFVSYGRQMVLCKTNARFQPKLFPQKVKQRDGNVLDLCCISAVGFRKLIFIYIKITRYNTEC